MTGVRNRADEAELLIEGDVLRTVGEGEESKMLRTPLGEEIHRPAEQPPGNALLPEIGPHGQRTEKPEAAPAGDEVRAHELAVAFRRDGGRWIGTPPRFHIAGIAHERHRIGKPEEGTEGQAADSIGSRQVPFF